MTHSAQMRGGFETLELPRDPEVVGLAVLEEQYDRILEQHGAALKRVAATYEADAGLCEDLFQDICLALWRALPNFRGESSERTFAFRIAHNRGLSHGWRRRRRPLVALDRVEEEGRGELLTDRRRSPEASVLARDRRRRLQAAVRRLPLAARQVVALSLEGLPQKEIAEVLGTSEGSVAVRLHRARKSLRDELAAGEGTTP